MWTMRGLIQLSPQNLVHTKEDNMSTYKTHSKRIPTSIDGVYYKAIISSKDEDKLNTLLKEKPLNEKELKKVIKNKIYIIRWRDENGKSKLKTIGKYSEGIREAYCKNKRDEIIVKTRLGEDLPHLAKKKSNVTLNDLAHTYFKEQSPFVKDMPKEQKRYDNHIKPKLGYFIADKIHLKQIEELQAELMEKFAPRTVNHIIFMIGTIYKHNIKKEYFKGISPTANFTGLEVDNKRDRYLTLEEIDKLLQSCKASSYEVWLYTKLLLSTGARAGGIISLKKKDINLDEYSIKIADHKATKVYALNPKTYDTFISDEELYNALIERLSTLNSNDNILLSHRATLDNKLKAILDILFNIGLNKDDRKNRVVIHTLRHTFASHLAINGEPIYNIQKLLNHKDLNSTLRYAKLNKKEKRRSVKNMYQKNEHIGNTDTSTLQK